MRFLVLVLDAFGGRGGIAKFNRDLIRALCAYPECEEVVAIPRKIFGPLEPFPSKLTYVTEARDNKLQYIFTALRKAFTNPKFDLILCGHIHLVPLASLLRIFLSCPLILIIHGVDAWKPTRNLLTNLLVRKIDAFISVSEFTKKKFLSWSGAKKAKSFILPNCVDLEQFSPGPKNPELLKRYGLEGKKVIMTLARLDARDRYKGVDEVLEVLPELRREVPHLNYLVVGEGTDRKRLEEKAKTLGLNGCVVFAGFIPESEKADHYRLADAYVMPGWGEGFGIVYLEALACGVPVVASTLDAGREALKNVKLGVLVDPKSSEEVKAGISKALRSSHGSPRVCLDEFSFENFKRRAHEIVREASKNHGADLTKKASLWNRLIKYTSLYII